MAEGEIVCYREATAADKGSVLAMYEDGVYGGRDYLPDYYDFFIEMSHVHPYVCLIDGKTVAFQTAIILDSEQTLVTRAGRVSPNYSGRGVFKRLTEYVIQSTKTKYGVTKKAITTTDGNRLASTPSFLQKNKLLCSNNLYHYILHLADSNKAVSSGSLDCVTEAQLHNFVTNPEITHYLFPRGRVILDWIPYRLLASNVPMMKAAGDRTWMLSDIKVCESKVAGMFSSSTTFKTQTTSFATNIDVFGDDTSSLEKHLSCHFIRLRERLTVSVSIFITTEADISEMTIDSICCKHGLLKSVWGDYKHLNVHFTKRFLCETEL